MKEQYFEIITLALQIALLVLTAFVVPSIRKWLETNTTKEQRKEATFWLSIAVQAAESIYKAKGAGTLKKEWVLDWCNKNNIKLSTEQLDILIDLIVKEFNKNGWNEPITLKSVVE